MRTFFCAENPQSKDTAWHLFLLVPLRVIKHTTRMLLKDTVFLGWAQPPTWNHRHETSSATPAISNFEMKMPHLDVCCIGRAPFTHSICEKRLVGVALYWINAFQRWGLDLPTVNQQNQPTLLRDLLPAETRRDHMNACVLIRESSAGI